MGAAYLSEHRSGTELSLHRHRDPYLAVVLDGCYEIRSLTGVFRVEPGDIIVHPWFDQHANRFAEDALVFNVPIPEGHSIGLGRMRVWRRSSEAIDHLEMLDADVLASTLDRLVGSKSARPRANSSAVLAALSHPGLSVGELAVQLDCRREYLHHVFRREFGVGPQAHRAELRRRRALLQLASDDSNLGQIAHRVGYADHAHFCRDWKRVTGLSPSQTRALVSSAGRTSVQDSDAPCEVSSTGWFSAVQ